MHERYISPPIEKIWSDENKLALWQKTELAVILAKVNRDEVPARIYDHIASVWNSKPINLAWWRKKDQEELHHDLNAFLAERLRFLTTEYHQYVHALITSYDTEEPAFGRMLTESLEVIGRQYEGAIAAIEALARKYRYTIMNARTHGQEAELQSFGSRCLTWLGDLRVANDTLQDAQRRLKYSKISGAIGKYGSIDPKLEIEALRILGFEPFYGSTQIMPRVLYVPVADALCNIVQVLNKIAGDIRLAARSGQAIMREPFGKKQMGSSAMPQKKNTINTENVGGMARLARAYAGAIRENIETWEERDICQSSVERVAWPDLFHATANALKKMTQVLEGLVVFPDRMADEIYRSHGTYGAAEAKEFLKKHGERFGLTHNDAYRIVQLACFNVFEPSTDRKRACGKIPESIDEGKSILGEVRVLIEETFEEMCPSIQDLIPGSQLRVSNELDIDEETVTRYNEALHKIFFGDYARQEWDKCFDPIYLLQHEEVLYREILGE